MTKREARKIAKENILQGKTKQETFEMLKESSDLSAEDLAKIIQLIPSMQARKKYNALNVILIVLLSITILFKILAALPSFIGRDAIWFPLIFLVPLINVLLLIGVVIYSAGSHKLVAILTILGLVRMVTNLSNIQFEPLMLIDFGMAAALIGLGFYLNAKLSPEYSKFKEYYQNDQGQDRMRMVIRFED